MDIDDLFKKKIVGSFDDYLDIEFITNISDKVYDRMIKVFGTHEKAREYFYTKITALENKRPYDYCLEKKQKEVYAELIRIEHGILA